MEKDIKKKNKRKKNKQAKNAEPTSAAPTVASVSANQMPNGSDQKQHTNVIQDEHVALPSATLDRHGVAASDASTEQVKQVQMEKEAYVNKENDLELEFSKLRNEKEYWLKKEGILEEKIKQLQMEKEEYIKKEADFGLVISKLQTEKDSWLHREAGYEEKISQLVNEASTTSSKEVFLEEKIKQLETERESWAQKENSATETISGLNADNARLRSQVMELEESQKNLSQENQQLLENISGLQRQIQKSAHLSSEIGVLEKEHIKSEMLAAQTMVENLLLENAKLAEKLNAERDLPCTMAELSSGGSDPVASTIKPANNAEHSSVITDPINLTAERVLSIPAAEYLAPKPDPVAGTPAIVVDDVSSEYQPLLEEKTMPVENEIEQIPPEESEASGTNLSVEDSSSEETSLVPISDAPLIGAPFRFISFMARYVSGADLVSQGT
ncbi:uncharacterized protein LOC141659531 isoform X2 [Apium graveolens]|uniref:uncharacterized protein LOC141659531 isoform X2 n=1 Tax=Apium graveolens TaxID=4045 RepID=UPI003D7BB22E